MVNLMHSVGQYNHFIKMLGKHVIVVIGAVVLVLVVLSLVKNNREKFVLAPLHAPLVSKYINQEWSIDMHSHILRIVKRDIDASSIEDLLGVIKYDSKKPGTGMNIMVGDDSASTVLDIYSYDYVDKRLGDLMYSISDPIDVTLGHAELYLESGYYIPMLRVGGTLKKSWMKALHVARPKTGNKAKANIYDRHPVPGVVNDDIERQAMADGGVLHMFKSGEVVPDSPLIVKNYLQLEVEEGDTVTLYYSNMSRSKSVVSARVMGSRVDEIVCETGLNKREWTVSAGGTIVFVENIYNIRELSDLSNRTSAIVTVR